MFFTPAVHLRRGTSLINTLRNLSLTTSLQGCYDFADVNCYSGSGQIINDLSGQGNGLVFGTSSGDATFDPTFSGTAGGLSSSDVIRAGASKFLSGTQPSWMQAVHKDNGKITIVSWAKTTSGSYSLNSLYTIYSNAGSLTYPGWAFGVSNGSVVTAGYPIFGVNNAAGTLVGHFNGTAVLGTGSWMFSACAIDEQAGTAVIQIDSVQYTGSISYASPATTDSPNQLLIGSDYATVQDKSMCALWSVALSAANLDAIYQATKARYGL